METALIFELLEMEDEMKVSYRRWAANATYSSLFLYMLQCLFTSEVNQCSLLADGNRNYDGEDAGRIGSVWRGREANGMEVSVKWFRESRALVFELAVPLRRACCTNT
jgi:hypothetical protein